MANITEISCERIANIRAFSQGININKVVSDSAKELLELEDACRNLVANEQEKRYRQDSMPTLAEPKVKLADIRLASQACQTGAARNQVPAELRGSKNPVLVQTLPCWGRWRHCASYYMQVTWRIYVTS